MAILTSIFFNPLRLLSLVGVIATAMVGVYLSLPIYQTYQQHQDQGVKVEATITWVSDRCDDRTREESCSVFADYYYSYAGNYYQTDGEKLIHPKLYHSLNQGMSLPATVLPNDPSNSLLVGNHTDYFEMAKIFTALFLGCLCCFCVNLSKAGQARNWFENLCFYSRGLVMFSAFAVALVGQFYMLKLSVGYIWGGLFIALLLFSALPGLLVSRINLADKLQDISQQEIRPPSHLSKVLIELTHLGFIRLGESAIKRPNLVFPIWYLRNSDGSIYVDVSGEKQASVSFVTHHHQSYFLETNYPRITSHPSPNNQLQADSESVTNAYHLHLKAMPPHRTIHPVLTLPQALSASLLYFEMQRPYLFQNALKEAIPRVAVAVGIVAFFAFWNSIGYQLPHLPQNIIVHISLASLILMHEIPGWLKQYGQSVWK